MAATPKSASRGRSRTEPSFRWYPFRPSRSVRSRPLSSTTERSSERGQVLVLFAGALLIMFVIAAMAFDVGMTLLERRDQQNAADSASLAGARYVLTSANYSGPCPAVPSTNRAVTEACRVGVANGFDNAAA